jgi:diacylglycerol kinase
MGKHSLFTVCVEVTNSAVKQTLRRISNEGYPEHEIKDMRSFYESMSIIIDKEAIIISQRAGGDMRLALGTDNV